MSLFLKSNENRTIEITIPAQFLSNLGTILVCSEIRNSLQVFSNYCQAKVAISENIILYFYEKSQHSLEYLKEKG